MTVCQYYLRGVCKYGDRCRNEHPPGASGNFGNQTWTSNNNRIAVPYTIETVTSDITPNKDKPLWPLASYGPAKYEPIVIGGLDESPEELRLKAVTALTAGTITEYAKYEAERTAAAEQMFANARDNVRQVYEQALKASIQSQAAGSTFASASSTFGASTTPSAFGTTTSAFGKPGLGQPVFGQTGFGSTTNDTSAFGQGAQGTSAFGTPSQPVSAFGQPSQTTSAFGQTPQTTSAFGQPSHPSSVFGQPSALGAATQSPSVVEKPSQQTSVFGQPSQPTSAFGQLPQPSSAFGQLPQPSSAFSQPSQPTSAFGQSAQPTSAFSQPSQATSTFGQTSQPTFGQSSLAKPATGALGATSGGFSAFASQPSAFTSAAAPSTTAMITSPNQSVFGTTPQVQSAFGTIPSVPGVSQPTPIGTSLFGNALSVPTSAPTMFSPASAVGGTFTSPMTITPSSEKFVSAMPDFAGAKSTAKMKPGADRYLELLPNDYSEIMPADVKAAFASTKFEWGQIPEWIPPHEVR